MPGIFQSLDIARRAIWANRLGLDVVSHNIANVNTPGYSRQRVELQNARPLQLIQGQLGLGVKADQIRRVRDQLLDFQYRRASYNLGKAQIQENTLLQVETIIQEPAENSLGNLLSEFFSEFSNLASEPENTAIRNTIVQKATALVDSFRSKYERLDALQESLIKEAKSAVNQINEFVRQIADLNTKIMAVDGSGGSANDLKDQRDLLLDKLSEYLDVRYVQDDKGNLTVSAEGIMLVSGDSANTISVETVAVDGVRQLSVSVGGKTIPLKNGKLGGMLELTNKTLPDLMNNINVMAKTVIEEVNRLHRAGKGLPIGSPPTAQTGLDFFVGTDARSIDINQDITENVANIAASVDGTPGNGEVALAISNLRNKAIFNARTDTLSDFYSNLVTQLGTQIQTASNTRSAQELLRDQIQNQRESVSGVSLDEEMTKLIQYQRALEAAARVVRVVDEVLETVVGLK